MSSRASNGILRYLRSAATPPGSVGLTDTQLLERFVATRDEAAFEVLVRRHAALVYGTCRRIVGDGPDGDDAFQATFLALALKAGSLRRREQLAGWLHGTARRAALEARRRTARQQGRERQVELMPHPAVESDPPAADLRQALDEELARLPDKYRLAIVLCDLEGRSRRDAAHELGVPEGTLSSRLATGRKLLAARLTRRGLSLGAGLAAFLAEQAAVAAPVSLVGSALQLAVVAALGEGAAEMVPSTVVAITQGVLKTMLVAKLKTVVTVVALFLLGVGLSASSWAQSSDKPARYYRAADGADGKTQPAAVARFTLTDTALTDEEFLRRVCLDLRGTLPSAVESAYFKSDKDANKRRKVVEWLLKDPIAQQKAAEYLLEGHADKVLRVWDLKANVDASPRVAAFNPDGKLLIVKGSDGKYTVVDPKTGKVLEWLLKYPREEAEPKILSRTLVAPAEDSVLRSARELGKLLQARPKRTADEEKLLRLLQEQTAEHDRQAQAREAEARRIAQFEALMREGAVEAERRARQFLLKAQQAEQAEQERQQLQKQIDELKKRLDQLKPGGKQEQSRADLLLLLESLQQQEQQVELRREAVRALGLIPKVAEPPKK